MDQKQTSVEKLNEFLRGEISAVETYRQVIERVKEETSRGQLEECLRSHEHRVTTLRQKISQAGGRPAESSGAWGAFAKLAEGGAKVLGEKAAIAALEEGEDHGLKLYRDEAEEVEAPLRHFVETTLLPAQETTHRSLSNLKHSLH
jgi:demethoxyubiquinone hydroxylase (CLK1/Coq7/Cat5 family)